MVPARLATFDMDSTKKANVEVDTPTPFDEVDF